MDEMHVVVSGGTGALGRAIVARLLGLGATVHVPWIADRELATFPHTTSVTLAKVELDNEAAVDAFYRGLPSLYASIHVAGGFAMSPIVDTSAAEFERLFRLNALTCFLCSREAIRAMRRSPRFGADGGRIVNVAARPVVRPAGSMIAYTASKACVASMTETLAEELKAERVLVNAVLPSIMDTPANRAAMPSADHSLWPTTAEVAEAIVFLAAPANALTSGALMPVYGRA